MKYLKNMDYYSDYEKLEFAQQLLSDVYFQYQDDNSTIGKALSCADTCISEALDDMIQIMKKEEN